MGTPEQAIELDYLSIDDLAGATRNDGTSGSGGYCISLLTPAIVAQGDPGKEMWTKYMDVFGEYDKRISDTWKEDADGLLVFVSYNHLISPFVAMTNQKTGLFSATVGAFIIESYKFLSPPDQTPALLGQISQQLAGFNGTFPNLPITPPPGPTTSVILVNAMWLTSLVLSITSALLATLLQQWSRRYIQMPQIPSLASQRARVRSYLFLGTLKYKMNLAVETVPTLLHISVFLFFIGLVIFFFTINKAVAIAVSVSVGVFAGIYFALTILPFFGHNCPYRTPVSSLWWYPWHASLSFGALCLRGIMEQLHGCLIPFNTGQPEEVPPGSMQDRLSKWLEICGVVVKKHQDRLKKGFEESIIQGASDAPADVDRETISRLLSRLTLADKRELPNFVASIPKGQIVKLMTPPIESGKIVFRESLISIRNCAVDANAAGLDEEVRKRCDMVSLEAVNHIAKAMTAFSGGPLRDVQTNFADIGYMRRVWADDDATIRVTSRSICALLARCLLRIQPLEAADVRWLEEVLGKSSNEIYTQRGGLASLDRDNLKSFVHGVFLHQEGVEDFPAVHATSFMETLAIPMGARTQAVPFDRAKFSQGIRGLIASMVEEDGTQSTLATKLRMFLDYLRPPADLPVPSPLPESEPAPEPAPVPTTNEIGRVSQDAFYTPGSAHDPTLQLPV